MPMGLGVRVLVAVTVVVAVAVLITLFVAKYPFTYRHLLPPPIPVPVPNYISYGALGALNCTDNVVIPSNSIVILYFHAHGNVGINNVNVYMAFPASIINEALGAFSKLPSPNDAMAIGVYVNDRLIAFSGTHSLLRV